MAKNKMTSATLEDVRIMFRNFSGKEGQFNREGDRNFAVALDPDTAGEMARDGWNIKQLKAREEGDIPQDYMQVKVNFGGRPPKVVMITSRGRTSLGEGEVDILDWVDIEKVDMIINPYEWTVSGKSGIKAYLQSIFITIREDELDLKYADVPEIQSGQKALTSGDYEDLGEIEEQNAIERSPF